MPFAKNEFQYIHYTGDNLVQILLFIRAKGHKEKNITTYQHWHEGNVDIGIQVKFEVENFQNLEPFTVVIGEYLFYDDELKYIYRTDQENFERHYTPIEQSDVF